MPSVRFIEKLSGFVELRLLKSDPKWTQGRIAVLFFIARMAEFSAIKQERLAVWGILNRLLLRDGFI